MLAVEYSVEHHDDHADHQRDDELLGELVGRKLLVNVGLVANHVRVEEEQIGHNCDLHRCNQDIEVLSWLLLLHDGEQSLEENIVPQQGVHQIEQRFKPLPPCHLRLD